jgi:pimeloyl-ACP methyl ester carboxylesterase/tRNA A-37 threonylcarbamoyl transferase component Bud32
MLPLREALPVGLFPNPIGCGKDIYSMEQEIRFCTARDGVRIAYATVGEGPPLVKTGNWLSHLEFDWESPIWRHYFEALASDHFLVRYDQRGNGLSDWNVGGLSFDLWVEDLESVVDAVGLERFALLGMSQGCAVSIAYAVRHPDRVSHLVLYGGYARGWAKRDKGAEVRRAMVTLIQQGWGTDNPAFRQMWTSLFLPGGTPEQMQWFNDLQKVSTSPDIAVKISEAHGDIDVSSLVAKVTAPTLVLHPREDAVVAFEEGRHLAASIPGARLVALESRNHLILEHEPAWPKLLAEVRDFLGTGSRTDRVQPSRSVTLSPGRSLGHYRIVSQIGAGGMGQVYRARDEKLEREVAIKVLPEEVSNDSTRVARFEREAKAIASLSHPNILAIHELGHERGTVYAATELLEGVTLRERLEDRPFTWQEAIDAAVQIVTGLAAAHEKGIVHRDLKPENLFLTNSGTVKILDFGLAKLTPRQESGTDFTSSETKTKLTQPGMVMGTFAYMSPEQLRGADVDHRSDIFSFGTILYEMLSSQHPFLADAVADTISNILRNDPPVVEKEGLPAAITELVNRCLAKSPEDRFEAANELAGKLRALRTEEPS